MVKLIGLSYEGVVGDLLLIAVYLSLYMEIKGEKKTTTKNKFIRYLSFIVFDFFYSCHHRLKLSTCIEEKRTFILTGEELVVPKRLHAWRKENWKLEIAAQRKVLRITRKEQHEKSSDFLQRH